MVKKIFLISLILCFSTITVSAKVKRASYSIKCYKCEQHAKKYKYEHSCPGCPTWRMFEKESKKNLVVYRCAHGHTLYITVENGEEIKK